MREATLRVSIKLCSRDECDPGIIWGEVKVSARPNRQVLDARNRVETIVAASKVPTRAAFEETSMLSRAVYAPGIAFKGEDGRRTEGHVTFVELVLELIPSVLLFILFRATYSPFNI